MPAVAVEQFIWTTKDITCVPDGVLGCHCYREKGKATSKFAECRQEYEEKRGLVYSLRGKQHSRLADSLREMEALLQQHAVVAMSWREEAEVAVLLDSGVLLLIGLSDSLLDPERLLVDRSLVGRLSSANVTSAGLGDGCLVLAADASPTVDVATFARPPRRGSQVEEGRAAPRRLEKLSALGLRVTALPLGLPDGLQVRKRVRFNCRGDKFAVWWSSHLWPPADDLRNVTVCVLEGGAPKQVAAFTTEFPLVALDFRRSLENELAVAEMQQKSKDNFVLHMSLHELRDTQLVLRRKTCVSLSDVVVAWDIHPREEIFLLRTDNGKCILYDLNYQQTKEVVLSNVAMARWHPLGVLFFTVSVSGELKCFDLAGGGVELLFQDAFAARPRAGVSLLKYFRCNKRLVRMTFCRARPSLLLLLHEGGPFSLVTTGDRAVCSSAADLVQHYCAEARPADAVRLLRALHWNSCPELCFLSLARILNAIMSGPSVRENIVLCEEALGSFYISRTPLSETVRLEFQERLMQLTRRFFFFLLRHRQMEKAFLLAEDLGHVDLFSDIYHAAMAVNDPVLAEVARLRAAQRRREEDEESSPNSEDGLLAIDEDDLPEELLAPDREEQFAFEESLLQGFSRMLALDDADATPRPSDSKDGTCRSQDV